MNSIKSDRNKVENLEYVEPEIWKDVVGYEGLYQVSNLGRVKRLKRTYKRKFKAGVVRKTTIPEIILKVCDNGNGYKHVGIQKNQKRKQCYVHRLVLEAFKGLEEGKEANHINGDKSDNRLINLEWMTRQENIDHASKNGLMRCSEYQKKQTSLANRGSGYGDSKLHEDDIPKIRSMRESGMTYKEIASVYDVNRGTIGCIIRGKTWTHV